MTYLEGAVLTLMEEEVNIMKDFENISHGYRGLLNWAPTRQSGTLWSQREYGAVTHWIK